MPTVFEMEKNIKEIIDDLKGLCSQNGLSNQAAEERIITSVFLYKFLNDKFMYHLSAFSEETGISVEDILKNENDELDAFYDSNATDVSFGYEDTIQGLINHISQDDFYKQFDAALVRISNSVRNEAFSVETADGSKRLYLNLYAMRLSLLQKITLQRLFLELFLRVSSTFRELLKVILIFTPQSLNILSRITMWPAELTQNTLLLRQSVLSLLSTLLV